LGQEIKTFPVQEFSGVALGMIDDGSAEVTVKIANLPELTIETIANVDKDWFLALRCEQIHSGQPLIAFIEGLSEGLLANITVRICSVEDPHHSWEGIFRALGTALNKIFVPPPTALPFDYQIEKIDTQADLKVLARALHYSQVFRGTAESHVKVAVDFSKQQPNQFTFNVDASIDVTQLPILLTQLAVELDCTLQVTFNATVLSSSHVVLEDTALVLGRALLEILKLRMEQWGVNGAGSSVWQETDFTSPIRVGVSVEGRKFWKFVPFDFSLAELRKNFLIGHTVCESLRSEDLDDFLDGLAGGLAASIIVHIATPVEADAGWQLVFKQLGKALQEVFRLNPARKGVPPGVKATLS
jgi:imidazoleglycerol phosphate dehydratase HisB